jgi:hypothetical protein
MCRLPATTAGSRNVTALPFFTMTICKDEPMRLTAGLMGGAGRAAEAEARFG